MKSLKIELGQDVEELKLYILADLHIGDQFCDIKKIRKEIEKISNEKDSYVILNGDLLNNATKNSVSDVYGEKMTPEDEYNLCVDILEPVKDKILAITAGNHEKRTWKESGIDLSKRIAERFDIIDRYDPDGLVLFLRFGTNKRAGKNIKQWYTLYITHGTGGGRKPGSKINRLNDMAAIVDADIYIHSHTHLPMIMKQTFYRLDNVHSAVNQVEKLFVNTSSQLDYGGYGQAGEYTPSSKDTPVIILNGIKKGFKAIL